MSITRRVLLWLEQSIEIPEAALHEVIRGHLLEAHLGEDLLELGPHLMFGPSITWYRITQMAMKWGGKGCNGQATSRHGKAEPAP